MLRPLVMVFISVALLITAIWIVDLEDVLRNLGRFPAWVVIGVFGLFGLNLVVVTFRLTRVLFHFGMSLPAGIISRASVSGYVAGLFFISIFGQVAGRHLVLNRFGVSSVLIATLTAYERSVLLLISGGLFLVGATLIIDSVTVMDFLADISLSEILLAAGGGFVLSLWLGRSKFEAHFISRAHSRANIANILEIAGITLVGQLLVLAAFVVGILALQPGMDYWELFAAAAIISFAASLPLTVNGWGVRELAAVYVLGELGIPSSEALAVSILVGLCSTAVILAASPMVLKKRGGPNLARPASIVNTGVDGFELEKAAAWIIATAAAVLIFFQMHVPLQGGIINLNLADPFAILALAATVLHVVHTRQFPCWRASEFNLALGAISVLLVFAFLRGVMEIGVTQWAFAGRMMGWLVLLGYLSIGHLTVSYMGSHGLRRFSETIISTAVVVVVVQIILRWLDHSGWVNGLHITLNFEGFAGNRNAFAFQMLVSSILILAYSSLYKKGYHRALLKAAAGGIGDTSKKISLVYKIAGGPRLLLFSLLHGFILAGIALSASRTGLIVASILLITAWVANLADRRMISLSLVFAIVVWVLPQLDIGSGSGSGGVQSAFSHVTSNLERWESIARGFEMWLESPFLGAGLGVFIERSTEWYKQSLVIHSTPVWILAEFGLLGLGIFVWVFVSLVRHVQRIGLALPAYRIIAMLLLVFLIFGLVHEIFYQRIFWLVMGAAWAISGHVNSRQNQTLAGDDYYGETSQIPLPGN